MPGHRAPVCGSDFRTYGNECEFQRSSCLYPYLNLTKLNDGPCKNVDCDKIVCPPNEILSPICGSDGKDYSNECVFQVASCKNTTITIVKYETCAKNKCPVTNCTEEYMPVCDPDGNVYPNACALQTKSCDIGAVITPVPCNGTVRPTQLPATTVTATRGATYTSAPFTKPVPTNIISGAEKSGVALIAVAMGAFVANLYV